MPIINLTPHAVTVLPEDGSAPVTYPPSGRVARLVARQGQFRYIQGEFVPSFTYGALEEPVERERNTAYIVSLVTALASFRPDFLFPFDEVRDENGRIVGCRTLAVVD